MQVEELAYKRHVQTNILLRPTRDFLLEGYLIPMYLDREIRAAERRNFRRMNISFRMGDEA
jgi:hypothetical protein